MFQDLDHQMKPLAIVRYNAKQVALCVSLQLDDDVQVIMDKTDARKLTEALRNAVEQEWPRRMLEKWGQSPQY
jgi:hypothetical protein